MFYYSFFFKLINFVYLSYNMERCKVCDEKAKLKVCSHCDRKACEECRKTHMEMLKRDLARLLNQVFIFKLCLKIKFCKINC